MLVFQPTINNDINMFAHLRSNPAANYNYITTCMRDNVRQNRASLLTGIDHSSAHVVGMLAEIHMREFACMMHTLKQVNRVAGKYHEHAFDNTDAYIEGQFPSQTHEMNAEQRHAAQLLLGVGKSYSEINVALRILDSGSFQAAMECSPEMCAKLSQQFIANASMAEDAFDRLNHMTKHVWSLVNLLAFSNLFRFADHIVLPNPEDSIFIPYIPMQPVVEGIWCHACGARTDEKYHKMTHPNSTFNLCPTCFNRPTMGETFDKLCEQEREQEREREREQQKLEQQTVKFDPSRHVCNECGKKFDPADMHHLIISPETGATPFYLCHKCGFKRDFPDEYRQEFPDEDEDDEPASESDNDDEANATYWLKTVDDWTAADRSNKSEMNAQTMNTPQEQRTYFKEIAEMLADEKITTEHACSLIEDLRDAGVTAEVMYSHHEQEKGFKEIAELLADRKITTEEACGLFTEWITEWSGWLL